MSGREIPINHYSPKDFTDICESLNHVCYYWDDKQNYMMDDFTFDTQRANQFGTFISQYLNDVMPGLYVDRELGIPLIADVLDKMFCDLYQPIEDYPYQYESWTEKEKSFNRLTVTIIFVNLGILAIILICRYFLPIWIFTLLTIASMTLLGYVIYKLMNLIGLSKRLFRLLVHTQNADDDNNERFRTNIL